MNYTALTEVLRKQFAALSKLLHLLEQERQALVANDPYRLEELERDKILVRQELQYLEDKRAGLCPADKTLSELAEASSPEQKKQLTELLEKLRLSCARLQEAQRLNKLLLEHSLAYVQMMQRALLPEREAYYGRGGNLKQGDMFKAPLARKLDETA